MSSEIHPFCDALINLLAIHDVATFVWSLEGKFRITFCILIHQILLTLNTNCVHCRAVHAVTTMVSQRYGAGRRCTRPSDSVTPGTLRTLSHRAERAGSAPTMLPVNLCRKPPSYSVLTTTCWTHWSERVWVVFRKSAGIIEQSQREQKNKK